MYLNRINAVARFQNEVARPVNEMVVGQSYKIQKLRFVNTRYGGRVVVTLKEFGQCFLPPRVHNALKNDNAAVQDMQEKIRREKLSLRYLGGNYNAIEFLEDDD